MKLVHFEAGQIRTPAFDQNVKLVEVWEELKRKIRFSSFEFYNLIKDMDYLALTAAPEKIRFTVWKYFNRSRFRATPFAEFAAFSNINYAKNNSDCLIQIEKNLLKHRFVDWSFRDNPTNKIVLSNNTILLMNSTLYQIGEDYRNIVFKDNSFRGSSVAVFPELQAILNLCLEKILYQDLKKIVYEQFDVSELAIEALVLELVDCQLLWTDQLPNITGPEYFTRVGWKKIDEVEYIISERRVTMGRFNLNVLRHLPELLHFISKHIPKAELSNLEVFKMNFVKKFGSQKITLSEAMDPEVGIGYGELEQMEQENELIETLKFTINKNQNKKKITYTPLHTYILNNFPANGCIKLENFDGPACDELNCLPNSISIVYRLYEGKPLILSAGGATATALLGRLSLVNTDIQNLGKSIVKFEENANPDIIFFDIAYQAEKHIDNVNRRGNLYSYELPILSWSCLPEPLAVSDILISVKNSEVILTSKKLGRRMIPRVASAYNYSRSDMSTYRFLCDLQHQSLKTELSFNMQEFFPDLDYYPRVMFKDIIVSAAKWKIPSELITQIKKGKATCAQLELKQWLEKQKIDFSFGSGTGDQVLYFDPVNENDRWAFVHFVRQKNSQDVYITEALKSKNDIVKDQYGFDYLTEFVINYGHEQTIYSPITKESIRYKANKNRKSIVPGGDWLYFEIYCSPFKATEILINYLNPYLKTNSNLFYKWFFIRYNDPNVHLRLRMHLKNPNFLQHMVNEMKSLLEEQVMTGIVSSIELKTYIPEEERYGVNRIHVVEEFFHLNSIYIMRLLSRTKHRNVIYATTILNLESLLSTCFVSLTDQILFVKTIANTFAKEFNTDPSAFKKLNAAFEIIQYNLEELAIPSLSRQSLLQKKLLSRILKKCELESKETIIADLIHMHVNRLFPTDQRIHEMIIYQFVVKRLLMIKAKMN